MAKYTQNELNKRDNIIKSQILFGNFLNKEIINELINLFEEGGIIKYIENERKLRDLDNTNVKFESKIYGFNKDNSTLNLTMYRNNIKFLHLSIHLTVKFLEPKNTGIIHISKNVYKGKTSKKHRYALIKVFHPENNTSSLLFSIADGYDTPGIKNENSYEDELQKEMDVIISVLNNIFNQKNYRFYIGKKKELINIHNKTDDVLRNINKRINYTQRKNRGNTYFQPAINMSNFHIKYKSKTKSQNKRKSKSKKITRRIPKK